MPARILRTNDAGFDRAEAEAVETLLKGELVVLPTETVYGLAGIDDPTAIDLIYKAKSRERGKPLPLLAADADVLPELGFTLSETEQKLARAFWPGPLTLILKRGSASEGVRVPDHAFVRHVIEKSGRLLRVTSANQSGEPPAVDAEMAIAALGNSAALIIDDGPVEGGVPSTVLKCGNGSFDIFREGAISQHSIEAVLKHL